MKAENVKLVSLLKEKGITISSVESMSGGLFASEIVSVEGASKVFLGSIVTYTNEIKEKILGINPKTIEEFNVVSSQVAILMAKKGQEIFNSDYSVSITGNAGPTASEGSEVGKVFIAIASKDNTWVYPLLLKGDRNKIREEAVAYMFSYLIKLIEAQATLK